MFSVTRLHATKSPVVNGEVLRDALKSLKLQDGALPDEKNRCHILARGRAELSRVRRVKSEMPREQ